MNKKLIFIVGPTGSGKSDLAIKIAEEALKKQMPTEIINADSIQVFDGLNIGSAKPSGEDLKRVKHHLIGHIPKGEDYTSGRFRKDVFEIIEKSPVENFVIVGGSGFYLKGLTHGLFEIPPIPEHVRDQVMEEDKEDLYQELKEVDPESARKINPNDTYRIQRAIEIFRAFGKPISEFRQEFEPQNLPFTYEKIGLKIPKEDLRIRVQIRTEKMLKDGLIEETQNLLKQGFKDWKALQSVGYKEVGRYLKGELDEADLVAEIVKSTMSLSKRQMTWFKKDTETVWFSIPEQIPEAVNNGLEFLAENVEN